MPNKPGTGDLYSSNNEFNANVTLTIGNTTVNTSANSIMFRLANSTVASNVGIGALQVGANVVVNTTVVAVGANVIANTTTILVGNSTVNTVVGNTTVAVGNSTYNTTITNITLTMGNTTVNTMANSGNIRIANSTVNTYIGAGTIQLGSLTWPGPGGIYGAQTGQSIQWFTERMDTHGDNVDLFVHDYRGRDSGGVLQAYGSMAVTAVLDNAGAETGKVSWWIYVNGTNAQRMSLGDGMIIGGSTTFPGSGKLRVDAILFAADTAAANELDDYEEGSWTPAYNFGGSSSGITYSTQSGTYTKIGNLVSARFRTILTNNGTGTGLAQMAGLPFTAGSGEDWCGQGFLGTGGSGMTAWHPMVIGGQATCNLVIPGPVADGYCSDTSITNTAEMLGSMQYRV